MASRYYNYSRTGLFKHFAITYLIQPHLTLSGWSLETYSDHDLGCRVQFPETFKDYWSVAEALTFEKQLHEATGWHWEPYVMDQYGGRQYSLLERLKRNRPLFFETTATLRLEGHSKLTKDVLSVFAWAVESRPAGFDLLPRKYEESVIYPVLFWIDDKTVGFEYQNIPFGSEDGYVDSVRVHARIPASKIGISMYGEVSAENQITRYTFYRKDLAPALP